MHKKYRADRGFRELRALNKHHSRETEKCSEIPTFFMPDHQTT